MLKRKIITASVLLASTLAMAKVTYITPEKIAELSKSKVLSNTYTRIVEGIDENKTYFLDVQYKGKQVNFFVDKATGAIYQGDRYDKDGKVSQFIKSPERLAKFTKTMKEGISFSYGTGKKDLYLFTDPQCPYCMKFERRAKGLLTDYTVHVMLFPLSFHKNAPAMTEWIMQGATDKDKHMRMEALMVDGSQEYKAFQSKDGNFKYSAKVQTAINNSRKAARLLSVTGTPIIFDGNFNKLNWGRLLQEEKVKKAQTAKK